MKFELPIPFEPWRKYPDISGPWWPVRLLDTDIGWIERVAKQRFEHARLSGFQCRSTLNGLDADISGLAGELAISLMLNAPLSAAFTTDLGKMHQGDVLDCIEVKTARGDSPRVWNLVVNQNNLKPDRIYVNVITAWYPDWAVIAGWTLGKNVAEHGRKALTGVGNPVYVLNLRHLSTPISLYDEPRIKGRPLF